MAIAVDAFLYDDVNVEKFWSHGISVDEVQQLLENAPALFRNHSDGAPYVMVGPTFGGRLITVPIEPTREPSTWRPRTAFPSKRSEVTRYRQQRSSKR